MTTYVPVGLTYLLQDGTGNVTINASDLASAAGKVGPVTLKLTNSSNSAVAVVSYDNSLLPPVPVTYTNVQAQSNYGNPILNITVDPLVNVPVATVANSNGSSYYTNVTVQVSGSLIGGEAAWVLFNITGTSAGDGPGQVTTLEYSTGYQPAGGGANLPTPGNPTKVFTIPPLASDLVQIPSSDLGSTVLVASGANVYVTPIEIVA